MADVFRRHGQSYLDSHPVPLEHRRVMNAIALCRTAALGGHLEKCSQCGREHPCYNPCSNRHCPKCQSLARAQWIEDRKSDLLDCPYFHAVFTVPEQIAAIALQNKRIVYGILFRATSQTLLTIAADPKHLGAQIGFFAVLHTWGQNLMHHPHLHCVVPGGGLSPDGSLWISSRPGFFLPVRVLSRLFRRLFLESLQKAFDAGQLRLAGSLASLADPAHWNAYLEPAGSAEWVVYTKPPFGGPAQVLDYVGRYTHRVAISNNRIRDISERHVSFQWKDYRDRSRQKVMTLEADEFIRRFLLHVLPQGFQRIRYYGFLANCQRKEKLEQCRVCLAMPEPVPQPETEPDYRRRGEQVTGISLRLCPVCRQGTLIPVRALAPLFCRSPFQDSS